MNPSNQNVPDGGGLEDKPAIDLSRLVQEFTVKEEDGLQKSAPPPPVACKSRPNPAMLPGRKKKPTRAKRRRQASDGQGSWGGRILVALVWIVTLGTGAGMASYHLNPGFKARFDGFTAQILPGGNKSLAQRIADPYKESMAKIETRGSSLLEASKAMGADPARKVSAEENARFEADLAAMSGEKSNVAVARNRRLQEQFGGAGTLELSKERAALEAKKAEEAHATKEKQNANPPPTVQEGDRKVEPQ